MKNKKLMSKELKEELDAFLYSYKTKKDETYLKVLSILNYLYLWIDLPDIEKLEFDLQSIDKLSEEYNKQVDQIENASKLNMFFEVFELFINAIDIDNLPDGQIKEYIKTI